MTKFKTFELGSWGLTYVRDCLEAGNTLSKVVLEEVDLAEGNLKTVAPHDLDPDRLRQLTEGGLLEELPEAHAFQASHERNFIMKPVPNMYSELAALVNSYLSEDREHVCLFEDALSESSDPVSSKVHLRRSTYGREVYYFLLDRDCESSIVMETIKEAKSHRFISIWTSFGKFARSFHGKDPAYEEEELALLARDTKKVIVGAYDGEGFLVWEK